jgi:hypothetical protein
MIDLERTVVSSSRRCDEEAAMNVFPNPKKEESIGIQNTNGFLFDFYIKTSRNPTPHAFH